MKYEFHIGDYVETVGGFVGWICRISDDGYIWVANKSVDSCEYYMPKQLEYFNRIGQYDFTKKDKIEPLKKSWALADNTDYYLNSCEVIEKINELVEVVNQLKEDGSKNK